MKTAEHYLKASENSHVRGGFNSRLYGDSWTDTMYGARGDIWRERGSGWNLANEMINAGKIFSEIKTEQGSIEFKCFKDGNQWCCVAPEFINLQESDCYSFDSSREKAISLFLDRYQDIKS